MNENIRAAWKWITTSRHTAWLEAEVERLRSECEEVRRQNWALVNSLVTTAGAPLPQEVMRLAASAAAAKASVDAGTAKAPRAVGGRKSWHQLSRALEIESTREFHAAATRRKGE